MHASFRKIFDEIETQRHALLESLATFSDEQLNKIPCPGRWSIAHILSHLITGERMSLLYVRKKMQAVKEVRDTGLWEEVKMVILKISQRLPGLKFKAPRKVVESTTLYHDLPAITREWENVRVEFKALLEKIPDEYLNRKIYRHPRAGYLNVKQGLIFFREHVIHHTPQIKRLAKQK